MKWIFIWAILLPPNDYVTATAQEFKDEGECRWAMNRAQDNFGRFNILLECRPLSLGPQGMAKNQGK